MRKPLILLALTFTAFIISVEITIVNVALPALSRDLSATSTQLQWVVDAYNLLFAAFVLAAGSLSDRQGRKGALLIGIGILLAACLGGAWVHSSGELIAARAVMGLGAATMFPTTLSILANVFTERVERARAIGLWGASTGFGIATGPIVGGWLLARFWWGSIFLFMALVAAVVMILVAAVIPTSRDPHTPPIDWRGLFLSSTGVGALVFGIIQAPEWGWQTSGTIACITTGFILLLIFAAAERRTSHPMLDVSLFSNLRFTAASGSVSISFFALNGFIFLITQYLQLVKSYSAFSMGVRLLPMAAAVGVSSIVGTWLAVRIGNKIVVGVGLVLFATALAWTSMNTAATPYSTMACEMILLGLGFGLTSAPATEAIMGAVPEEKAGVGAAVNDATRLLGATLGVAVIGSVASSIYLHRLDSTLPAQLPDAAAAAARGSFGGALAAADTLGHQGFIDSARNLADAATAAFLHSMEGGSLLAAGVALAGALMAAMLLPARPRTSSSPDHVAVEIPTPAER